MCLATVYIASDGEMKEVMRDVSGIETREEGLLFTDLFGEERLMPVRLERIDLSDGIAVVTPI